MRIDRQKSGGRPWAGPCCGSFKVSLSDAVEVAAGQRADARSAPTQIVVLVLLAVFLLVGCPAQEPGRPGKTVTDRAIRAVATTGMVADMVRAVGGERVEVTALMGPGVDPHLFRASESHVRLLSEADIIFYNGLHLEAKLGDVLEQMGNTPTVAIAERLPEEKLLAADAAMGGQFDPHVWFDAMLWSGCIDAVRDGLTRLDPEHASGYMERAAEYRSQLAALDAYARETVAGIPQKARVLVTAHDAFRYFGQAYDIEVVGLQGISTEAEAGTGDVQRLAKLIAERKIPAIFVESSIPKRNIEAVQAAVQARGWDVQIGGTLFSDALGNEGTPAGTYAGMVQYNVDTIAAALKPSAE